MKIQYLDTKEKFMFKKQKTVKGVFEQTTSDITCIIEETKTKRSNNNNKIMDLTTQQVILEEDNKALNQEIERGYKAIENLKNLFRIDE